MSCLVIPPRPTQEPATVKRASSSERVGCAVLVSLSCMLSGCGGTTPPPQTASESTAASEPDPGEEFGVSQEVGALPVEQANYAFDTAAKGIQRCFFSHAKEFEFLGGVVDFHVTVNQQADVVGVFTQRSTLGHHETEECMLEALRDTTWPAAVGGQVATAQRSFEFTPSDEMRPPIEWDASMVQDVVSENHDSVEACKSGTHGTFAVTLYVATDGSPMSVGVAPPDAALDEQRSCLLTLVRGLAFPSPGSWPAKVNIRL